MTCVVGLIAPDGVYIAADSCGSDGSVATVRKDPKVFRRGDFVIGCTTSFRFIQIIRFHLQAPPRKMGQATDEYLVTDWVDALRTTLEAHGYTRKEKEGEQSGGTALIAYDGRLFSLHDDFQIAEADCPYQAIGSGNQVALGSLFATAITAMAPNERIVAAIMAAVTHTPHVRPPVLVERLGAKVAAE